MISWSPRIFSWKERDCEFGFPTLLSRVALRRPPNLQQWLRGPGVDLGEWGRVKVLFRCRRDSPVQSWNGGMARPDTQRTGLGRRGACLWKEASIFYHCMCSCPVYLSWLLLMRPKGSMQMAGLGPISWWWWLSPAPLECEGLSLAYLTIQGSSD